MLADVVQFNSAFYNAKLLPTCTRGKILFKGFAKNSNAHCYQPDMEWPVWVRPWRTSSWWDNFIKEVVVPQEWPKNVWISRLTLIKFHMWKEQQQKERRGRDRRAYSFLFLPRFSAPNQRSNNLDRSFLGDIHFGKKTLWHANSIPSFSMSLLTCVFVTKHIVWRPGRLCGDSSRWKILQVFLCYTLNIRSACTIDKTNLSQINASSTFNISIMFSTLASFVWGLTGALLIMSFSCVLFFCNGLMV